MRLNVNVLNINITFNINVLNINVAIFTYSTRA